MEGFNQERRGIFDGLKVPFDVNAILLSALAVVIFVIGAKAIEVLFHMPTPTTSLIVGMITNVTGRIPRIGGIIEDVFSLGHDKPSFEPAVWIAFLTWFSLVWAFFAGSICRIAAMKIAREEGLELKEALRFGASKFVPNLLSIGFVVAIVGFFYFVCNSTIAGLVGRIPYVGEILVSVLFFLVLLSSFFIVFAGVLGILGFNLSAAAIAAEASDTFDGVSRAWNYILARPWQVILTYCLTLAYIGIFLFCGTLFEKVAVKSLSIGSWGMGDKPRIVEVDDLTASYMGGPVKAHQKVAIPGKGEFLYRRLVLKDPAFNATEGAGSSQESVLYYPQVDPETGAALPGLEELEKNPKLQGKLNVWPVLEGSLKFTAHAVWFWLGLAKLIILAYSVSYFFCSMTTIYFLLRKDVEGDDYTEINLEEDEEDDEAFEGGIIADKDPAKPDEKRSLPIVTGGEKKDDHKHDHKH